MAAIAARIRGSRLGYYGLMIGLMVAGGGAGYLGGVALEAARTLRFLNPSLTMLLGMWAGLFAYTRLCRPFLVSRYRRRMAARGLDVQINQTLTLGDQTLTLSSGPVEKAASWSAVTEIFRAKDYWVFLVQMEPWFAPSRFFSNKMEEQEFIRAALANMSEEAKKRSEAAVRFVSP